MLRLRLLLFAIVTLAVPSPSAGQANEWLISGSRVGKAAIGMSVDALYSVYGRDNVRLVDLFGEGMFNPALQIYLPFEQGAPALVASIAHVCGQFRVSAVAVHSARYRTADGVGVGSTVAEVRRHYPDARASREEGPSLIVPALKLTFALGDDAFADAARVMKVWISGPLPDSVRSACR